MNEDPPAKPDIQKVRRNVLAEKPRVTRFAIKWYIFFLETELDYVYADFHCYRDSEDTAPAEYPPEQPEADALEDDENAYGAEELQEEEAEAAVVDEEGIAVKPTEGEDHEMGGIESAVDPTANGEVPVKEEDEEAEGSDAGSEDLEADSSGSDEEDLEDEEGAEGDEDMEMGDDAEEHKTEGQQQPGHQDSASVQHHAEVMVH
jgi:histone chaperone ASF1